MFIFEQTNHFELDKYVDALYSSFDKFVFPNNDGDENSRQINQNVQQLQNVTMVSEDDQLQNVITEGENTNQFLHGKLREMDKSFVDQDARRSIRRHKRHHSRSFHVHAQFRHN